MSLLRRRHLIHLVLEFDVLLHPILSELVVEHALVRVLQLLRVDPLLFYLLRSLHAPSFVSLPLLLLKLVFLFLLAQSEVCHMLLIDMSLFIECCALGGKVALLVCVPRIVVKLRGCGQVCS